MLTIRPVTDLRYKFSEIEKNIRDGDPVFLTKNGYGSMVVMSMESYSQLIDTTEKALDEADIYAKLNSKRLSHEEVFTEIRNQINAKQTV